MDIRSVPQSIWRGEPKDRGRKLLILGFLISVGGAIITFVGGLLREQGIGLLGSLVLILGWGGLILGVASVFVGIATNWWFMFGQKDKPKSDR